MASAPIASAITMTRPTLSWSQVMNVERFMCASQAAEEVADVRVVARRHLLRGAEEADLAVGQQGDVRRHEERRADVVRHDDARDAQLALELLDEAGDRNGGERVEAGGG